jgi:hypothetical protein
MENRMENQSTPLSPYSVSLHEHVGDRFQLQFHCMAEDADHAAEQAKNAYPECEVVLCTALEGNLLGDSWLRSVKPGMRVWWNDPAYGATSGYYEVIAVNGERVEWTDTVLYLKNAHESTAEVFASELCERQPDDLYAVVDGDAGSVTVYGYAATKETAIAAGNAALVDEVVDAFLAQNVTLPDGTVLTKAWVVLTSPVSEQANVRLTLDVTYALNGMTTEELVGRLHKQLERAIGEGLLTGETPAEVDQYMLDTITLPCPAVEKALCRF